MKITAKLIILTNLAWVGLFMVVPAGAQQPVEATLSQAPADQPVASETPFEPVPSGDSVLYEGNPFLPDPSLLAGCDEEGQGPRCQYCGEGNCDPRPWYTDQDFRIFTRRGPRKDTHITYHDNYKPFEQRFVAEPVFGTKAVEFNVAAGYGVSLGRWIGSGPYGYDRFVEAVYWGLHDWSMVASNTGVLETVQDPQFPQPLTFGTLKSGFDLRLGYDSSVGGFNRALEHRIEYGSEINNTELNIRLRARGRADRLVMLPNGCWQRECQANNYASCLVGVRLITVEEHFHFRSTGTFQVGSSAPAPVGGDYFTNTYNTMLGLQFGGDFIRRDCKWSYGVRAKAGPFVNFSDAKIWASNDATADVLATNPINFALAADTADVAFLAELGFIGSYKFRPNLTFHAAYDYTYILGLALAPRQMIYDINPPSVIDVDTQGSVYYRGLSLGLEYAW